MDSNFDFSNKRTQQFDLDAENSQFLTKKMSQVYSAEQTTYHAVKIGQSFGRYTIEQELGRGGMGIVYKAYDTNLKRTVALKVILKGSRKDFERFSRESSAMAKLDHPNIIRVHDFAEYPQPHFTMEYIDGFTLADLIREKQVRPLFLMNVVIKVCDALAHAHSFHILHRDIKPSNIMITNKGEPKILDFGLAKVFDSGENNLSQTGDVLGTILYMAPEQLDGYATKKSDIYSVGATMYEALTYRNVHQGDTYHNIAFQILERDPIPLRQLNSDISPYFEAVCLKCLAKKQDKRYASFKQLTKELKNLKSGRKIIAKRYSSLDAVKSFVKYYKAVCISTFAVFSILVVSLIYSLQLQKIASLERDKVRKANAKIAEERNRTKLALNKVMNILKYAVENHERLEKDKKFSKLFSQIFEDTENYGENQDWTFLKGFIAQQNGDKKKSLEYYNQRLKDNPQDVKVYNNRGHLYVQLGEFDKALADYNKGLQLDPGSLDLYNNRGSLYKNLKKYSAALADYNKAIRIHPLHAATFNNRGVLYGILGRHKKAIIDYNKAIEINPNYIKALINRAELYVKLRKYREAMIEYNRVIQMNPLYIGGYMGKAFVYRKLGNYERSVQDYNKAIKLDPKNAEAYLYRATVFRLWRKYQAAESDYTSAIELDPQNFGYYNDRGLLFKELERYEESLRDYSKALELNSGIFEMYVNRGDVYVMLKRYKEAFDDYNRASKIGPSHPSVYNGKGIIYRDLKNYKEAIRSFNQAIALDPKYSIAYLNLGITYYDSQNFAKAAENFEKTLQFSPNLWKVHHWLYRCYNRLNKIQEAQYHLQKFQEMNKRK